MIREAVQRWLFAGKAPKLGEQYPAQRENAVTSYETSNLTYLLNGERYNPDDLVATKGLSIYARMLVDEQVKSVTEFKLNAILGRGWHFKYGHTKLSKKQQKERIDVFEAICKKVRGSFLDCIEGVATGRDFGFSISEKVYGKIDYDGKQWQGLNMLLTRDPASFKFFVDEYGLLKEIKQQAAGKPDLPIDRAKIIHYVHKPKWDLQYGRSELRSAYRCWYLKDVIVKLWAMHLEKFGSGIPVASLNESNIAVDSREYQTLQNAMINFKAMTSIILPSKVTAEVHFPSTTDQYEKALQYFDLGIAKSQLVPNLMGVSHTGQTGAYSQSQTQFQAFFWTTTTDGKRLEECLNEQLFRDLGDQNWGDGDYPYFCFKPMTLDTAIQLLAAWKEQLGAGTVIPTEDDERFIRELLEMPERDEEAEPLVDPMAERQQTHTEEQAAIAADQKQQELDQKAKAANADRYTAQPITVTVNNPAPTPTPAQNLLPTITGTGGAAVVPHGRLRTASLEQFTRAASRVAFSVIERRTDATAEAVVGNLAGIVAKATARALGDDENMRALTDDDQADVADMQLADVDKRKLKLAAREMLVEAWTLGSNLAANELDRARGERTELSARRSHFVSLRDNAVTYFDTQSFRMAGDTSDAVRKIIQQELQNGIKFGKTIPEIREAIWERLLSKGMTTFEAVKAVESDDAVIAALADLGLDVVEEVPAYLNTLVRTNTFEALNEARFAEFTDPAVGGFVMAMEYAAVLDSSTTEICRELNGKVYRADSPEWDEIRPPNHFNCRSVLVPVTTVDEWDGQESERPDVEPAEGFG